MSNLTVGDDYKLRLLLRSVYLKGHQDGNLKTSDMSWEDKIVEDILSLPLSPEKMKEAGLVRRPTEREMENAALTSKLKEVEGFIEQVSRDVASVWAYRASEALAKIREGK
jgi:hypothetical protein